MYNSLLKFNRVRELFFHLADDGGLAVASLPIDENGSTSTQTIDAKKPKFEQKIIKQEEKTDVKLIEKSKKTVKEVKDIEPEEEQVGKTSAALSAGPMTKPVGKQ